MHRRQEAAGNSPPPQRQAQLRSGACRGHGRGFRTHVPDPQPNAQLRLPPGGQGPAPGLLPDRPGGHPQFPEAGGGHHLPQLNRPRGLQVICGPLFYADCLQLIDRKFPIWYNAQ